MAYVLCGSVSGLQSSMIAETCSYRLVLFLYIAVAWRSVVRMVVIVSYMLFPNWAHRIQ